jgi:hypothetical protein
MPWVPGAGLRLVSPGMYLGSELEIHLSQNYYILMTKVFFLLK